MASKQNKKTPQKPAAPANIKPQNIVQQKQPAGPKGKFSLNIKLAFLLGIISLIVYANTIKNGFVLDDSTVITKNTVVSRGISAIPEILYTPYRKGFHKSINDLYRPLSLVMFAAEYQFFAKDPMPYHLINIVLFACCVIMLFLFLDKLFERKKTAVAFIASLLFALHPLHTEVVANIKSADELLCFFFAFLCLSVFVKYMQTGEMKQLLLGAFCFFLSILSKETVITFVAVIPLIFFFYLNENKKRSVDITVSIVVVAVISFIIRFSVLSYYHANTFTAVNIIDNALAKVDLSSQSRIATAILILGYYIKLLIIPYPLVCDYSYNTIPFVNFDNIYVLASLALYIFLGVFSIKRFLKNNKDYYAFAILFFLITISLFTNITFLLGTTMGERLLFFPSLGFCLLAALLIEKWLGKAPASGAGILKQPGVLAIIIPVSIAYSVIIINRNTDWASNYTLYVSDIKKSGESSKLNYWLGLELENVMAPDEKDPIKYKAMMDEAIVYLQKAVAIDPAFTDAQVTLGHAFGHNSQDDSAEYHDRFAMKLEPQKVDPVNNLAGVYFRRRQYQEAIEYYRKTIGLSPDYVNPYGNLAACYGTLGKFDSSIYYARMAIKVDPTFPLSYQVLATTFKIMGQADSSKKYEAIAHKNNPNFKL